uniref:NADH dehydrogenase [ubiquinone] 1 alpha subcomplex subunit 12 n=1 Tax=Arcella intermedia TaxID=1963864 RepID=A0A6B2LNQ9_9EUKA
MRWLKNRGQVKAGNLVGQDQFGNLYYEDTNPQGTVSTLSGRDRYVEFSKIYNFNASQIPPEWHSWLHHLGDLPATEITKKYEPRYHIPHQANPTGSNNAFAPHNYMKGKAFNPNQAVNQPAETSASVEHSQRWSPEEL